MKEEQPNIWRTWLIISVVVNIWLIICIRSDENDLPTVQKIKSDPIDTLWTTDSAYIIKSKIDSVYYDPKDQDPPLDRY